MDRDKYDATKDIIVWEEQKEISGKDYMIRGRAYNGGAEKIEVCVLGRAKDDGTRGVYSMRRLTPDVIYGVYALLQMRRMGIKTETPDASKAFEMAGRVMNGDELAPPPPLADGDIPDEDVPF